MKLGLGTAQFGADYGISNRNGRVRAAELERILHLAADLGVHTLDTAAAYGEAETALGRALWQGHPFRIVTKCPPLGEGEVRREHVAQLSGHFYRSLERLRQPSVHGLLMHRAADLCRPGAELLFEQLANLQREGLVSKVGASFYTSAEIAAVGKVLAPGLAQVPVSLVDQRLLRDGTLASMRADGIEVHARSVFLQGLLLMDPDRVPAQFAAHVPLLRRIERHAAAAGISKLALAIGFVAALREIDTLLVGVTSAAELREVVEASKTRLPLQDCAEFSSDADELVNPSRWRGTEALANA